MPQFPHPAAHSSASQSPGVAATRPHHASCHAAGLDAVDQGRRHQLAMFIAEEDLAIFMDELEDGYENMLANTGRGAPGHAEAALKHYDASVSAYQRQAPPPQRDMLQEHFEAGREVLLMRAARDECAARQAYYTSRLAAQLSQSQAVIAQDPSQMDDELADFAHLTEASGLAMAEKKILIEGAELALLTAMLRARLNSEAEFRRRWLEAADAPDGKAARDKNAGFELFREASKALAPEILAGLCDQARALEKARELSDGIDYARHLEQWQLKLSHYQQLDPALIAADESLQEAERKLLQIRQKAQRQNLNRISRILARRHRGRGFDAANEKERGDVNLLWNYVAGSRDLLEDVELQAYLRDLLRDTKILPQAALQILEMALAHDDRLIPALEMVDDLLAIAPGALTATPAGTAIAGALALTHDARRAGLEPDVIINRFRAAIAQSSDG